MTAKETAAAAAAWTALREREKRLTLERLRGTISILKRSAGFVLVSVLGNVDFSLFRLCREHPGTASVFNLNHHQKRTDKELTHSVNDCQRKMPHPTL